MNDKLWKPLRDHLIQSVIFSAPNPNIIKIWAGIEADINMWIYALWGNTKAIKQIKSADIEEMYSNCLEVYIRLISSSE